MWSLLPASANSMHWQSQISCFQQPAHISGANGSLEIRTSFNCFMYFKLLCTLLVSKNEYFLSISW